MSNEVNRSNTVSNGTNTIIQAAGPQASWNLTYLGISLSGPEVDSTAKVIVYDGDTSGDVLFASHLASSVGSVGTRHEIALPKTSSGRQALQGTPGNAMTVELVGTGVMETIVNARFEDGAPK